MWIGSPCDISVGSSGSSGLKDERVKQLQYNGWGILKHININEKKL